MTLYLLTLIESLHISSSLMRIRLTVEPPTSTSSDVFSDDAVIRLKAAIPALALTPTKVGEICAAQIHLYRFLT